MKNEFFFIEIVIFSRANVIFAEKMSFYRRKCYSFEENVIFSKTKCLLSKKM